MEACLTDPDIESILVEIVPDEIGHHSNTTRPATAPKALRSRPSRAPVSSSASASPTTGPSTARPAKARPRLDRVVFKTSRFLDFVGKRELTAQIGHPVEEWPLVILKEVVDNGIDSCEEAGTAPAITVEVATAAGTAAIRISDNGPGIASETIADILDYSVRVSSREAYVSPTRGAQGNALKTTPDGVRAIGHAGRDRDRKPEHGAPHRLRR